ncbi:hypothetical protein ACFY9Q_22925 [Streptomyces sp. NPDC012389]|uniref:hypothetical protein n=1 Tax=Streptomyces sp. NPDC012389 TaxID=3364830 RepID=UPI0036E2EF03
MPSGDLQGRRRSCEAESVEEQVVARLGRQQLLYRNPAPTVNPPTYAREGPRLRPHRTGRGLSCAYSSLASVLSRPRGG